MIGIEGIGIQPLLFGSSYYENTNQIVTFSTLFLAVILLISYFIAFKILTFLSEQKHHAHTTNGHSKM